MATAKFKISDLSTIGTVDRDNDFLIINDADGPETKKVSVTNLLSGGSPSDPAVINGTIQINAEANNATDPYPALDVNGVIKAWRIAAMPSEGQLPNYPNSSVAQFEGFCFGSPDNFDSGMFTNGDDRVCFFIGGYASRTVPALNISTRALPVGSANGVLYDQTIVVGSTSPDGGGDNARIGININNAEGRVHINGNATTDDDRDTPALYIHSGFDTQNGTLAEPWNAQEAVVVRGHTSTEGIAYSYRFCARPNDGNLGAIDGSIGETFEGFVFARPDNQDSGMVSQGDDTVAIVLGGGAPRGDDTNYADAALFIGTRRPDKGANASEAFDEAWGANPAAGTGENGRVGVNTSRPEARFHVNGNCNGASDNSNPAAKIDGNLLLNPGATDVSSMLSNGEMTFEFTNNTTITIRAKGSDGVVRTGTITLS